MPLFLKHRPNAAAHQHAAALALPRHPPNAHLNLLRRACVKVKPLEHHARALCRLQLGVRKVARAEVVVRMLPPKIRLQHRKVDFVALLAVIHKLLPLLHTVLRDG